MSDANNQDRERNREIAQNEAHREAVSSVRVSTWAIGVAVIIGLVVLAIVLAWINR